MSLEFREGQENISGEDSQSKNSIIKTHKIKKSPKPIKRPLEPAFEKKQSLFSSLRLLPQFGVFENEVQKQLRLEKFWRQQIDTYYKSHIDKHEKDMLISIIEDQVPSLQEMIQTSNEILAPEKVGFDQLYRYIELIRQLKTFGNTLILVENKERHYLAIFSGNQLQKMIEVSLEEAYLVSKRQLFIINLQERQEKYNQIHQTNHQLSQISTQIAYLLHLMRINKVKINQQIGKVLEKIFIQPISFIKPLESVQDRYISCLIKKNIKIALMNIDIDELNYFHNLDIIQQYGSIQPNQLHTINNKKELQEYMKRKRSKKTRKNPKGVLKTACGGCLSPHHQQYNPFLYCSDCHIRFHKYCYTASIDNLCESCSIKKSPLTKGRGLQCQFCSNRGLLSLPSKLNREGGVSIHIFCMLINGLWKFQNGVLEFKSSNFSTRDSHDEICTVGTCNSTVYTYPCRICRRRAHPLCAYLAGWNMELSSNDQVILQCCSVGLDKQKQSHRRKFMLNYKKILYKSQRER